MFTKKYIPEGFKGDLLPSPPDERDYALSSVAPIVKRYPEAILPPFDLTISHQGATPSCVGHACSTIKQYLELKEKVSKDFDGDWLYYKCKEVDGIPQIQGTYLRTGLEILRKVGAKPIDENDPSPYRIKMYVRNDDNSFEGIKKAYFLFGNVLAGFTGSNAGWQGSTVRAPKAGESVWGHAVAITGYEKDYLVGQNSWGPEAHNKGLFYVPKNYLPFETWSVVIDEETGSVPQPIKTGWVAINYIQTIGGITKTTANLNVRSEAGTGFSVIKTLEKGTILQLTNAPRKSANGYLWDQIVL